MASRVLDFSPAELPDANTWPTHGALRERLLLACRTIELPGCHAARDAFLAELVRLSPPELARLVRRYCICFRSTTLLQYEAAWKTLLMHFCQS